MVFARRQMFCGSPAGPDLAGLPADDAADRHRVQADLYGEGREVERDAERLARFGRPVFVIWRSGATSGAREGDLARSATRLLVSPAFTRMPERFEEAARRGRASRSTGCARRNSAGPRRSASQRSRTAAMPKRPVISTARADRREARSGSVSTRSIAAAKAGTSPGGTSTPSTPSRTISRAARTDSRRKPPARRSPSPRRAPSGTRPSARRERTRRTPPRGLWMVVVHPRHAGSLVNAEPRALGPRAAGAQLALALDLERPLGMARGERGGNPPSSRRSKPLLRTPGVPWRGCAWAPRPRAARARARRLRLRRPAARPDSA